MTMMLNKIAFFFALVATASVVQAQDTMAPMMGNSTICEAEFSAIEMCVTENGCEESCPALFNDDEMASEGGEDDMFGPDFDYTDTEALKTAVENAFNTQCNDSKQQLCASQECCPACVQQFETALSCAYTDAIQEGSAAIEDLLSQLDGAVGEGLGFLNDVVSGLTNETIAPTGGEGGGLLAGLGDIFSGDNLMCDFSNNPCDGTTSAPGDGGTSGTSGTSGSSTGTDASGVSSVGFILAGIATAAGMVFLVL